MCGHCCVAMAARASLRRVVALIGHEGATSAAELAAALAALNVKCSARLRRVSRSKPILPKRALVVIARDGVERERTHRRHWVLAWDGVILDPGGRWPEGYANWRMVSYLEVE